jgi:hypothetical protein
VAEVAPLEVEDVALAVGGPLVVSRAVEPDELQAVEIRSGVTSSVPTSVRRRVLAFGRVTASPA